MKKFFVFSNNLTWVSHHCWRPCFLLYSLRLPSSYEEKNNIIQYKHIFDLSAHFINQCPFKWLFECDNELVSVHDLYLNFSTGLTFLECFNTSVGIKVTYRSFRTILGMLNNLTALILWTPSSKIKLEAFLSVFFLIIIDQKYRHRTQHLVLALVASN